MHSRIIKALFGGSGLPNSAQKEDTYHKSLVGGQVRTVLLIRSWPLKKQASES